ncbi:MAG: SAM-dependent methyltransferase [Caulobacteraceae bacterium]|nr:SAM-dependent methyltransferase [Caulobacteraceae bacterium]
MSLADRLKAEIAATGPIAVSDYMARCLFDPADGYYAVRPALGEDGDFITAPLVSQMFGELIGLWATETWLRMGAPSRVLLVEMGPGDGTLMSDALRAARLAPAFLEAADLWLIDPSGPLRARQARALSDAPLSPRWAETLEALPEDAPVLLIANELLDCLPARQFLRDGPGWAERVVGLDAQGALALGLRPALRPEGAPADLPPGLVWELSVAQQALGLQVAGRVTATGGAALFIDYGRDRPEAGDTLQALHRHCKVDPLADPGRADLTVWADFPAFQAAARAAGAASGLLNQGTFLRRLGVEQRAAALAAARPDRQEMVARQLSRLIDDDQMGRLFKAVAIWNPADAPPPAFEDLAEEAS